MCIIYMIALIIYLLQYIITKKMLYSTSQKTRETESRFFSVLLTQFKFLKIIKLFNTRELFNTKLDTSYKALYNATMKLQKVMCIFQSNQIIVSTLFRIVLLLFGGIQVINGRVSIGNFSVLLGYLGVVMNSVVYFANLGQSYVATLVSYNRLKELIDFNEESNGEEVLTQINTISLQNLSYGYNGNFLIQKFDYVFEKGKIYCICGANGIGKTTFFDILVGLNQEYMGKISYNQNIDLKNIDNYMMREQLCCYVSQDALLYEDSILNNILVNREGIDRREVERLAKQIGLFREGSSDTCLTLDYIIDDNKENLSGGERQKIALLRSFIGIKDLIIYDEPTSYLDSDTRNFFIGKLLEMKEKNKIVIIITHDKELCKYCDDVINLENYKK
ncbi:MAG: ABC transporter ATP-binding protein/permease, partial [Lachnospiraceae bacterium]|nr:ABC transporter ATP-binding protein/permease [Lachnospiraceae bacterium]